jgi:hypothetical protein
MSKEIMKIQVGNITKYYREITESEYLFQLAVNLNVTNLPPLEERIPLNNSTTIPRPINSVERVKKPNGKISLNELYTTLSNLSKDSVLKGFMSPVEGVIVSSRQEDPYVHWTLGHDSELFVKLSIEQKHSEVYVYCIKWKNSKADRKVTAQTYRNSYEELSLETPGYNGLGARFMFVFVTDTGLSAFTGVYHKIKGTSFKNHKNEPKFTKTPLMKLDGTVFNTLNWENMTNKKGAPRSIVLKHAENFNKKAKPHNEEIVDVEEETSSEED